LENTAVKNDRPASNLGHPEAAAAESAWSRFWFTPIPTTGLHALRVLCGLLFCFWLLSFLGHQQAFFSLNGWIDREALIEMQRQPNLTSAPIGWSILFLAENSPARFEALYWSSLAILALFTLGVATRVTGVLSWVVVVSFLANPATSYEGDYLLGILAFYLMLGYLLLGLWNGQLSPLERIFGARADFVLGRWLSIQPRAARPPSYAANMVLHLLQIHMAIIIVTSGLHKLQMGDWWAGVALWYPLHPPLQTTAESLRREMPNATVTLFFLSIACYLVLGWQIGFPLFAWRRIVWRGVLLGGAALGWLGSIFVFRLPLFGPFVFLGCLSFLRPDEWLWLKERARRILGHASTGESKKAAPSVAPEKIKK
jgi:hypothetical protein